MRARGPYYALRLSNELNVGQQLITRHLDVIQRSGIVETFRESSQRGPPKKMFALTRFFSIRIDFAPYLYYQNLATFDDPEEWIAAPNELEDFERELQHIREDDASTHQLNPLRSFVSQIDRELTTLEQRLARLLYLRNLTMEATSRSMTEMTRHERQLVHHLIDQGPTSIADLSRALQLREETIRQLFLTLHRDKIVDSEEERLQIQFE